MDKREENSGKTTLFRTCASLLVRMFLIVAAVVILLTVLMTAVYMIPTERIDRNVRKSADIINEEGVYPFLYSWCYSRLDNYTDALFLLEAAGPVSGNALRDAMAVPYGNYEVWTAPTEVMLLHYMYHKPYTKTEIYPRYWSAQLIFLKPLLLFTDYAGIRNIYRVLQSALFILAVVMLCRSGLALAAVPFSLAFLMMIPPVMWRSIHFNPCVCLSLLGAAAVLFLKKSGCRNSLAYLFLVIGALTSSFDMFSIPALTLGIPAVVLLISSDRQNVLKTWLRLFMAFFCWGFGYVLVWTSKWFLSTAILKEDVVADALGQAAIRASSQANRPDQSPFFYPSVMKKIRHVFWDNPFKYALRIYIAVISFYLVIRLVRLVIKIVKARRAAEKSVLSAFSDGLPAIGRVLAGGILPAAAISSMPYVWYALTLNHSGTHAFFTCKILIITIFSVFCIPVILIQEINRAESAL